MQEKSRYGFWSAFAGVALQLIGLSWDALLHHFDPDLAANEGVFSLTNPSHLVLVLGLTLTVAGVLWGLYFSTNSPQGLRPPAATAVSGLTLVALLATTAGIALATGGISGEHDHGTADDHSVAEDHPPAGEADVSSSNPALAALQQIVRDSGTEQALTRLEELAAQEQSILSEAHNIAHDLGRFSFTFYGNARDAFAHCRQTFQSGCYHGVLEEYFVGNPDFTREDIAGLCETNIGATGTDFVRFQCLHGLGHGLTFHFKHDIIEALGYCDALKTDWDRSSCYGGVFMENIVFASQPPGHQHSGEHVSFLNAEDPLYPCNSLDSKYLYQCYLMQTSAILMFNAYDFKKAFQTCLEAPREFVSVCYQSLGRDISGFTLRDTDKSLELCQLGQAEYMSFCFVGVVKNFIDVTWTTDQAFSLCQRVPVDSKASCYTAIGEQVAGLYSDQNSKTSECAKAETEYVAACSIGARLTSQG